MQSQPNYFNLQKLVQEQSSTIAKQTFRIESLESKNKIYENELKAAQKELENLKNNLEKQVFHSTFGHHMLIKK